MAGLSSVVAKGFGGAPIYGGTPFGALAGKAFPGGGGVQSILAAQSLNPPRPGPTPAATGATTEAQNQWLAPGNMPIDEGAVAYQRQLEAGKVKAEQDAAAATAAAGVGTAARAQTGALQEAAAGKEAGYGTAAREQAGKIALGSAASVQTAEQKAAAAAAGYATEAAAAEAGYGTAARTQTGEQQAAAAAKAAGYGSEAATQANTFKVAGTQQAYDLSQKGADANQARMFAGLDKLGINSLISQTSGGGGGAPSVAPVGGGDAGWGAANAAAIGRAKDTSAAAVGAAERRMQNNMGSRGIAGSGIEAKQDMGIQLAGAGELGAAGRQVAEGTATRAGAVADRNYTGEITQRGQDISAASAAAAQKNAMLQSLMSLFKVSASY